MKKYIIIKTGDTFDWIKNELGDFEDWIIKVMGIDPALFQIVNVPKGDPLPKLDECKSVVITGSHAMITDDIDWNMAIEKWVPQLISAKVPVLGICYGHQLLARAMGGVVDYHPKGVEAGTTGIQCLESASSDPLFKEMPVKFDAHVSHSQSVIQLPENAVLLAENDFEGHHSFRVGECAWGIQFHPEFDDIIMTKYAKNMKKLIADSNQDPDEILANIKPTPEASSIMKRFAEFAPEKAKRLTMNDSQMHIIDKYIPGSIGRISEMHADYYSKNWNFGLYFEAKVASELSEFLKRFNNDTDGIWLAVLNGRVEGSVIIDGEDAQNEGAHLRWFILSDALKGQGVGKQLLKKAVDFCAGKGYQRTYLWTFEGLSAARHLYEEIGFKFVRQQSGIQWGTEVNEQYFVSTILKKD